MSTQAKEEQLLAKLDGIVRRASDMALTAATSLRALSADLALAEAVLEELFEKSVDQAVDLERLLDVLVRALNEPAE